MDAIISAMKPLEYTFKLKEFQIESILHYSEKKDTFCLAPTGSGKSLTYELAPLIFDYIQKGYIDIHDITSCVVVIQPLKALMEENVQRLNQKGLSAIYLGNEEPGMKQQLMTGKFNYIFASPESVTGDGTFSSIFQPGKLADRVKLLVVDESHCIKKW